MANIPTTPRDGHYLALLRITSDVVYRMSHDWTELLELHGTGFVAKTELPATDWLTRYIPKSDRKVVMAAIRKSIRTKKTFELEHRVIHADGGIAWASSRAIPMLDDAGNVIEWLGSAVDITNRKASEDSLARLEVQAEDERRLYQTILSNTPDFVYVFDLDHRFIYANAALLTMWGKSSEEALGKTCLELGYEPWHAEMHDREIEQVVATKAHIRGDVPFTGTQGRRVYDYIFAPVLNAAGNVVAIAGTTRDITKRKAAEDALREADRRKDEFLAMLAHELRNPLAPIANAVQLLKHENILAPVQQQANSIIERQTKRLARLVDDLLEVSRITSGRIQLHREDISLAGVVERAVETARPLIESRRHLLDVRLPDDPVWLHADATRLEQVIVNILNNAAKYMDEAGRIELSASIEGRTVVIRIRDFGIGIEPDLLPRVFDLFAQADGALDRSHGGLGVGLYLVRRLVEMHEGSVNVNSEVGKGSEFTITLATVRPIARSIQEFPAAAGAAKPINILVVDDNVDAANSLAQLLRVSGHMVRTAYDGPSAIDAALKEKPDIAFLDIGLPKLDGYQVAKFLRNDGKKLAIKLVAMTGYGQNADRVRSRAAGFDEHLVKPVDFKKVEEVVSSVQNANKAYDATAGNV